jgi:5-methylcytosine-specific restriction protein A
MKKQYTAKIALLIFILGILLFINYNYNNIIIRAYNQFTGISKTIVVFVSIISFIIPALYIDIPFFRNKEIPSFRTNSPPKLIKKHTTTKSIRNVPESVKKYVAANQYWKCKGCNNLLDETYEIDHILALEDNGTNDLDNLQALCRNCHGKKTARNNIMKRFVK